LDPEIEKEFNEQAQKRRRLMAESIMTKEPNEVLIEAAEK
jgi:hypothetical protein